MKQDGGRCKGVRRFAPVVGAKCVDSSGLRLGRIAKEEAWLVGALVHVGDAVVPAEAIFIEHGPEIAKPERKRGEAHGEQAAAHGGAGGVFVREGAEGDTGVAHAGGGV